MGCNVSPLRQWVGLAFQPDLAPYYCLTSPNRVERE